eukprot:TRINITY_DN11585_c0_g1_i2.p1 TRINITY_DN11585_c0_g1~~TRINITY_DN11585_c0_g1_i2.p1  ORF type:complete len:287 (+),score=40.36 TRINITY_DN11585_c0_g1_i2:64-861(+)
MKPYKLFIQADDAIVPVIESIQVRPVAKVKQDWIYVENGLLLSSGQADGSYLEKKNIQLMLKKQTTPRTTWILDCFGFNRTSCDVSGINEIAHFTSDECGEIALEIAVVYTNKMVQTFRTHSTLVFSHHLDNWDVVTPILDQPEYAPIGEVVFGGNLLTKPRSDRSGTTLRTFSVQMQVEALQEYKVCEATHRMPVLDAGRNEKHHQLIQGPGMALKKRIQEQHQALVLDFPPVNQGSQADPNPANVAMNQRNNEEHMDLANIED